MQPDKPIAIDFFCGAGGVAAGLKRAGFYVVGVDIEPQPHYLGDEFVQADALAVLRRFHEPTKKDVLRTLVRMASLLWASPPCQRWTALKTAPGAQEHPDLIRPTRRYLKRTGQPYVIENVEGAPLIHPVLLCGHMFDLGVKVGRKTFNLERHRLFEANFPIRPPRHVHAEGPTVGVYGGHARCRSAGHGGRGTRDFVGYSQREIAALALDLPGLTLAEMSQAIPPAYSEFIGKSFLRYQEGKNRC